MNHLVIHLLAVRDRDVLKWPLYPVAPVAGWRFDGDGNAASRTFLISPNGAKFGPLDVLNYDQVSELRGIGRARVSEYVSKGRLRTVAPGVTGIYARDAVAL